MTKRIALVAGATGLVGRECLRLLAEDANVEEVRALVRKPLSVETQALGIRECRVDFDRLEEHADWFEVDWAFCALGTTMRQAGSQDAFLRVDFDYASRFDGNELFRLIWFNRSRASFRSSSSLDDNECNAPSPNRSRYASSICRRLWSLSCMEGRESSKCRANCEPINRNWR